MKQILFIIPILLFIFACDPPVEPAKDTEKPVISFTQEATRQFSGSVELDFKATDNKAIKHIQISIDGTVVAEKDFTNSSEVFSFQWDTKTVEDGLHTIKVIVDDDAGNTTVKTFDITVRNILLKISIPASFIADGNSCWIFLSDNSGNIIGTQQAKNNSELIFPVPNGFSDSTFVFNLFEKNVHQNGPSTLVERMIESYTDIKPGIFSFSGTVTNAEPSQDKGTFTITINDVPQGYRGIAGGSVFGTGTAYTNGSYVMSVKLTKDQSDISVALYSDDGSSRFTFIENAQVNSDTTFSFNDLTTMEMTSLSTTGADYIFQSQSGFKAGSNTGYLYNQYGSWTDTDYRDAVRSYQPPAGIFNSYVSMFVEDVADLSNYHITVGSLPALDFKRLPTAISSYEITEKDLKINFSNVKGTYLNLGSTRTTQTDAGSVVDSWNVSTPVALHVEAKLANIPTELINAEFSTGTPDYTFDFLSVVYYDILNYQELIANKFTDQHKAMDAYEFLFQTQPLPNSGGRKGPNLYRPPMYIPGNKAQSLKSIFLSRGIPVRSF